MSRARQLADLGNVTTRLDEVGNTDGALSNRNLIINGAMQVAQRGTSFTNVSDRQYCLDRWTQEHADATFDLDVTQDTGPEEEGFPYSLKATVQTTTTLTSTGYIIPFEQRIEYLNMRHLGYGTAGASTLTLSFWIKSNRTGDYTVDMTKGGPTRSVIMPYSISSAGVWEKKILTIPPDAVDIISGNVTLFWWMIAGSSFTSGTTQSEWAAQVAANRAVGCSNSTTVGDYWQITGIQLEVGDTATPFEHRSYGDELARCQRYFQVGGVVYFRAYQVAGAYAGQGFELKSTMRATPTFAFGGDATWTNTNITGDPVVSPEGNSAYIAYALWSASGDGRFQNTSSSYFTFDAEL